MKKTRKGRGTRSTGIDGNTDDTEAGAGTPRIMRGDISGGTDRIHGLGVPDASVMMATMKSEDEDMDDEEILA